MPMTEHQRREYLQRAGITTEQIEQTIGGLTVDRAGARAIGLSDSEVIEARQAVRQIMEDCTAISAAYNEVAKRTNRDARQAVDDADIDRDRALLGELMTDDYQFTDPSGNVGNRETTVNTILSGKVRKNSFGRGGFETTTETFKVYGTTAVSVGEFSMRGMGLARNTKAGEVAERSRSGTYRTTHTYVYRDGRWRLAASQMTRVPVCEEWEFIDD